jgi:hypothetical protein
VLPTVWHCSKVRLSAGARTLRWLLSRFPSVVEKAFRWLVGVAAVLAVLFVLLETARQVWISGICLTDVLAKIPGVSGFDFEVSETDCWHSPAVSVFVSMPGGSKKTRLFQYHRGTNPVPVITSIDERTVQISLANASSISCRREKWGALTIKYDIGPVEYPSVHAQPPEC